MSRDFEISPDFPSKSYTDIFVIVDRFIKATQPELQTVVSSINPWTEFTGGWNAVRARFEGCTDASEAYTKLVIAAGNSPSIPTRYTQDNELFIFFFAGFAVMDSLAYALFSLGNMLASPDFPMATEKNLKSINFASTAKRFSTRYPNEDLSVMLSALSTTTKYVELKNVRNILAHRVAPGRNLYMGGDKNGLAEWTIGVAIDANTTQARRFWLCKQLACLLCATEIFLANHMIINQINAV